MKPEKFFKRFKALQQTDLEMSKRKNHDYAGTDDALDNFRVFGFYGVVVRMHDKMKRLEHFVKSGEYKVKEESVFDTLADLRVYSIIAELIFEAEQEAEANDRT